MSHTTSAPAPVALEARPEAHRFHMSRIARLHRTFLELAEEHRLVLSLHFLERLTLEQIAVVLDDTEESVREVYVEAVALLTGHTEPRRDVA